MLKEEEGYLRTNNWVNHLNQQISLFEATKHRLLAWLASVITTIFILIWLLLDLILTEGLIKNEVISILLIAIVLYLIMQFIIERLGFGIFILTKFLFEGYEDRKISFKKILEYTQKRRRSFALLIVLDVFTSILVTAVLLFISMIWIFNYKIILDILIAVRIVAILILIVIVPLYLVKLSSIIKFYEQTESFKKGIDFGVKLHGIPIIIWHLFQIGIIIFLILFGINISENFQNIWRISIVSIVIVILYYCARTLHLALKINSKKVIYNDLRDQILLDEISNIEEIKGLYRRIERYIKSRDFIILNLSEIMEGDTIYD